MYFPVSSSAMGIDRWNNFFVMVGGGAAALAGLVFIAMSINLSLITRDATHKNRAIATLTGFTAVFMICAFALIGNQNYQWIGAEWLVVSLVPTITYIRVYVRATKMGRSSVGLSIGRYPWHLMILENTFAMFFVLRDF